MICQSFIGIKICQIVTGFDLHNNVFSSNTSNIIFFKGLFNVELTLIYGFVQKNHKGKTLCTQKQKKKNHVMDFQIPSYYIENLNSK
jgi:hypothetical protein